MLTDAQNKPFLFPKGPTQAFILSIQTFWNVDRIFIDDLSTEGEDFRSSRQACWVSLHTSWPAVAPKTMKGYDSFESKLWVKMHTLRGVWLYLHVMSLEYQILKTFPKRVKLEKLQGKNREWVDLRISKINLCCSTGCIRLSYIVRAII